MRLFAVLACGCLILHGQTAFEVATIKPSAPVEFGRTSIRRSVEKETGTKGRLRYEGMSLLDLISDANRVQLLQVSGPEWLGSQRFDILAVIPAANTPQQIPEMLGAMLRERFALKTHDTTKEMQVYTLAAVNGGVGLESAEKESGISAKTTKTDERINGRLTMSGLAAYLSGRLNRPVVDRTGLEGAYEIQLEWSPDTAGADAAGPSIFTAIREQLGLRLESGKAPVRLVAVDAVEKNPTEN